VHTRFHTSIVFAISSKEPVNRVVGAAKSLATAIFHSSARQRPLLAVPGHWYNRRHPSSVNPSSPPSLLCAFLPHCRTRCSRPLVLQFGSQEIGMVMRSFIRRSPDYAQGDEGDGMATMSRSSSLISSSTSIPMKGYYFFPALMCYSLVSTIDLDTNILCSMASIHLMHARCM
jgi:hypothetical protein